ncbi:MAG TPA: ComEC/Rec2 family competence protein [Microvirga sp.]|nr:ComEC/Rec2 family competence protein [Microvirga sp.]
MPRVIARAAVLPWIAPASADWRLAEGRDWLRRSLVCEVEQRRLFPWIPVCFGIGIILFFQAEEPALWAPLTALSLCIATAILSRRRPAALAVMIGLSALFAGFTAGAIRARNVAAPVLQRTTIAALTGFVETVEDREGGKRLLVRVSGIEGVAEAERPHLVRVSVRNGDGLAAGQFIGGTARLLPPPEPAWPGGYDFARDAYYKGIGGVGSFTGAMKRLDPPGAPPWPLAVAAWIDEARNALTQRIASAIGGAAGGVGAALVTGKRGLIPEETNDVLRGAGIFHIVSISGLHMVLAAGTFFWLARALLALSPRLALLRPVKKIAAAAAMAGATVYCVFSGSDVATVRSLVMTLVMFGAVLADRPALSIRNLSIAALIVLAFEPEALLGPSFQMSFGAVAAMMGLVPLLQWKSFEGRPETPVDRTVRWIFHAVTGLIATTLVASLATAPFAAYHFQTLNPYGLIGNALALPLVSLVVMPSAVLGVLAYPFGLDRPVWQLMGWAVARVLEVSVWVDGIGGSTLVVPALGVGALCLLSLALLVLALPASGLRWFALLPAGIGVALAAAPDRFDVYIDREGTGAAIRNAGGKLSVVGRPSAFVTEQWLRADGDGRSPDDASLRRDARCDRTGCVVESRAGRSVAFVQDLSAFEEDCRRAAVVIARLKAPAACGAALALDRQALAERGATAIRFGTEEIEIRSVRKGSESVPWQGRGTMEASASANENGPRRARPVPEQDFPDEEISSGEPD